MTYFDAYAWIMCRYAY